MKQKYDYNTFGEQKYVDRLGFRILDILPKLSLYLAFFIYVIFSLVFVNTYTYYEVQNTSMRPLLNDSSTNDGVYLNNFAEVEVGDVIIAINPEERTKTVIKRLMAVGGDKIAITFDNATTTYVVKRIAKGHSSAYTVLEPYITGQGMPQVYNDFITLLTTTENKENIGGIDYLVLEDDEIFYMGDNRVSSRDCIDYGPSKRADVIGRVDIIVKEQKYFIISIIKYLFGFQTI